LFLMFFMLFQMLVLIKFTVYSLQSASFLGVKSTNPGVQPLALSTCRQKL
jgi:hypothetical protein